MMKTIDDIVKYKQQCMDGRDITRLAEFIPHELLKEVGLRTVDDEHHEHKKLTRQAVMVHLASDLAFAFEKALDQRGISASFMYSVIKMWNWVLEEGLEDPDDESVYAQYGLPYLKATALQYGLPNPIGDDVGNERKYEG